MATAASSYNVLIRVQAAQARREIRAFSAEIAAAKRAAQQVNGLGQGAQSSRTLASTNTQVSSSYRNVAKTAQSATTATNNYAAATARATTVARRFAAANTSAAGRVGGSSRVLAGRTAAAVASDPTASSISRTGTAAAGAESRVTALTTQVRSYSAAARVAHRNTDLLTGSLGRLGPAATGATAGLRTVATQTGLIAASAKGAAADLTVATGAAAAGAAAAETAGVRAADVIGDRMNRLRSLGASMTWAGRQVSMAFTLPFVLGAGAAVKWQMDVEKAATRMIKVYDDVSDGIVQITGEDGNLTFNGSPMDRFLTALSNKMGQSKAELTDIAADWAQVGLTGGNVAAATRLTSEAMILGDMEAVDAAKALVSIQAQYNLAFGDFNSERERAQRAASGDAQAAREQAEAKVTLTGVLAQLNMIENQTATSMADLITGFSRSAVFAKEAGVSAQFLGAHLAALIPATGSAERAGNALKTIYASLGTDKTAKQVASLEGLAINAGLAADAFTNAEFRSRGLETGIEDIARAYIQLDGASKLQWGKDVFGIYQMVRGMHLLDDVARGLGETITEDGKSLSVLAAQFSTLADEGARSAFILREFGLDGSEVETIQDAVTGTEKLVNVKEDLIRQLEREASATSDVSYYREALSGQDSSKIYEQYSRELQAVLSSNPRELQRAWVVVQNSMMKAIIPMLPLIIGLAQTIAKVAQAFGNLDPRWQKLIVYALAFLAIVGPLSILLGSTILMFALMGKSLVFLSGMLGLTGVKAAGVAAAFRGMARFLSGGRLFGSVGKHAKVAGDAIEDGVTKKAAGLGPKLGGLLKGVGARVGPMLLSGIQGGLGALARLGPMLFKVLTGPIGLAIAAVTGVLAYGGVTISDMFGAMFSGVGDRVRELLYDGDIPIFARPFVAGVEIIAKTLGNLPTLVNTVFTGVFRAISRAAKAIYEMFSYINPFARHSPSLVENVTAGMSAVSRQFAVAGASISGTMRSAYADIAAFGSKTASLRLRADQMETDKKRTTIRTNAPAALPEFDRLVSSRGVLSAELEDVNTRIKAQQQVVDGAQRAIDGYDRTIERMNRSLTMAQRRLDAVQSSLDAAQKRYDYFATANIAGLSQMEDQLFANEMAQKRLQLAMADAGADSLDKTSDILAKIAGQLDDLSASRNDLRLAGAGSDILGVYDAQIAGLRGQQQGLMDPASDSIASMADELEKLQQRAERMELEKALQFDPLTRQIEQFKDSSATLPFEQIMAGLTSSGAQVDLYQGQVDGLTRAMDSQRDAMTAVEDARYNAQMAQQAEQEILTALTESQTELQNVISEIDSALQITIDSIEKYTAAMEEAKRASDDLAASGGVGGAGGAEDAGSMFGAADGEDILGQIPGEVDIEAMIAQMEQDLADAFNGIDLFPSFEGIKERIGIWWDETVMQWFRDLPGNLGDMLGSMVSGTAYLLGFILGSAQDLRQTFDDWVNGAIAEVQTWPGRIWTFLQEIDWSAVDWGGILRTVLRLGDPRFWLDITEDLRTEFKQVALDAFLGFLTGLLEWKDKIGTWIDENIVQPFVEGWRKALDIQSPSRVTMDIGRDTIQGFIDGLFALVGRVTDWASELPGRIMDGIGDASTWLLEAGKDIVRGLLDGAGSILPTVGQFFLDKLPKWIQGGFKKALGIESPSKVFAEYGQNIGEGLIVGIEAMQSAVSGAGSALAAAAIPDDITVSAPTVTASAAAPAQSGPDPFETLAAGAQQNLPQIAAAASASADQMALDYSSTVAAMEAQVLLGQQAYAASYMATENSVSAHAIATAQNTSTATVATAQQMAASTIATVQQMAIGTTSATDLMASGVTNSANVMAAGVVNAMSSMAAQVSGIISGQVAPAIGSFDPMLANAVGWFDAATNNIGTIWSRVGPATADPSRFVINEVYDTGLRGAWNNFNEFLGVGALPSFRASFATGGVMPGYTPGRDVHRFISPTGGQLDLSGGEAIMRPEWTRAVGGPSAVEAMNRAARSGRLEQLAKGDRDFHKQAFAGGGVVQAMTRIVQMKYPQMVMTSGLDARPGNHGLGLAADFAWPGAFGNHPAQLALARDIAKTYPNSMELIYDSPGWANNIKNGANVGPFGQFYTMAQAGAHHHHVHWAMNTPPTMPFGGGVFLGGSGGEGAGGPAFTMDWGAYIGDAFKEAFAGIKDPGFAGGIGKWVPKSIDKAMTGKDFLVKKAEEMTSFQGEIDGSLGAVERWRPMMKAALIKQGLGHWAEDPAILNRFMRQIQSESGGNPSILQQIQDVNSGGNEALGLAQIIPGTFAAYRDPSLPNDRTDPWANLNAMARYVRGRYGENGYLSIGNGIGYDSGGWLQPGLTTAVNATGKPEAILTSEQWNAIYRSVSARPVEFTVSNADLARRINEQLSSTFTDPVMNILGEAREMVAVTTETAVETRSLWDRIESGLTGLSTLAGEAKVLHEATLSAIEQTNEILAADERLAEVAGLVSEAMQEAFAAGGELPRKQIEALTRIATDYFAPVVELATEGIKAAQAGRPMDSGRVGELAEAAQGAIASVGTLIDAWSPVVTQITSMVGNIADLKRIQLSSWAAYGSPGNFGQVVERGLVGLANIGIDTFNLAKNVLPALVNNAVGIGKTVVGFAAENAPALAALVGAVVTGNPLAALPFLPQLLGFALELIPQIITAITQIVPMLIKGISDLFGSVLAFFTGGKAFTYADEEAASRAVAENLDAIRKGTFRPGQEPKSGTLTPAPQSTNISIGQVVLPNVKGTDAKKFVTNLENISG